MSTRGKYRITPDEEDAICFEVEDLIRGIFNLRIKENARDMVEQVLNKELIKGDELHFHYNIDLGVQFLEGALGKLRKETINLPSPTKIKRSHKRKE